MPVASGFYIAYIDVPTAFSPNNDGNNDVLYVVGENIKTFRLEMFDRFGNKVFETDNMKNGWDGTKNGELLEPSVFFYQLFYNSFYNKSYILKGNVTLFR